MTTRQDIKTVYAPGNVTFFVNRDADDYIVFIPEGYILQTHSLTMEEADVVQAAFKIPSSDAEGRLSLLRNSSLFVEVSAANFKPELDKRRSETN